MITNKIRLAAPVTEESIADGLGIRMVIWNQGCELKCEGCQNPCTHSLSGGKEVNISSLLYFIKSKAKIHNGITLSGGDPFLQPEANAIIADYAHSLGLDVWAYCGLTYNQILKDKKKKELLKHIDVLVDGPFILGQRDTTLAFRGSTNQRIIDVKKSLSSGKVILYQL